MLVQQPVRDVPVTRLGDNQFRSPLHRATQPGQGVMPFVNDHVRVRATGEVILGEDNPEELLFEKAGPREHLFFDPAQTRAAIVTCGGLCPGLNDVVHAVFSELFENYQVREVYGIRHGYQGLDPAGGEEPFLLTEEWVGGIRHRGGTFLGTSRGNREASTMVDTLVRHKINILFCVGGDGTQRGAHAIIEEIQQRGLAISVIGIPKTIDNDIIYCDRTFGFVTAVSVASSVIRNAHTEAKGVINGVGLVKVMGRDAGFIACGATLASQEADFCLIPECPFELDAFLATLQRRVEKHRHAVVVAAEGAGQNLFAHDSAEYDASGNRKHRDIGTFLKEQITGHFRDRHIPIDVKYIDPSYIIRSAPANTEDCLLCDMLGRAAVHAAMAGRSDVLIGYKNGKLIHVPITMIVSGKHRVDPEGPLWAAVLAATGQPIQFRKS